MSYYTCPECGHRRPRKEEDCLVCMGLTFTQERYPVENKEDVEEENSYSFL